MSSARIESLREVAAEIRIRTLDMVTLAKASHVAGALSMADILAVLYGVGGRLLVRDGEPAWPNRDRFLLSKGHACTALYAALSLRGFVAREQLERYAQDGQPLMSHASHKVPGIELSTGSLGHALPVACGLALGARIKAEAWRTVVILSDGELDEGSNWEAAMFAAHHRLGRLVAIVDNNRMQAMGPVESVLSLGSLPDKFRSFGWDVVDLDGHDLHALYGALDLDSRAATGRPLVIVANTIKGKGVDFMENDIVWHYRNPSTEQRDVAVAQLRAGRVS